PLLFAMEFPPSAHLIEVNPDYERASLPRLASFIELKTREIMGEQRAYFGGGLQSVRNRTETE
ncbi:MAG: hypothetical protein J2P52_05705, partial [Blastocatellia bacterium]|nr:hypothetical protein [Blastocatellia bacterium]